MHNKIAELEARYVQLYIQYSSLALLYYDYSLTLSDEIKFVWQSKFTFSTFLYVWCRYALAANLVYLLGYLGIIRGSCDMGYLLVSGALSIIGRFSVLAAWGLRTYAVYGSSRIILAWFVSLGLASFISDTIHVAGIQCQGAARFPTAGKLLSIIVCCFELSSTILTVVRCYQTLKVTGNVRSQRKTFIYLVAEQGIAYTVVVSGFTFGALILNFRYSGGFLQRLLNALTLPISGLMTARFLLHLRKWDRKRTLQSTGRPLSNVVFADADRTPTTLISEFGEDPVQCAWREAQETSVP